MTEQKKKRLELAPLPRRSLYAKSDAPRPKREGRKKVSEKLEQIKDFVISGQVAQKAVDKLSKRRARRNPGGTKLIALRVDMDTLERWRATGTGWQSRMKDLLRKHAP